MSEEDLELLITTDDPGEDTLGEDTFHHPTEKTGRLIHKRRRNDQQTEVTVDSESAG